MGWIKYACIEAKAFPLLYTQRVYSTQVNVSFQGWKTKLCTHRAVNFVENLIKDYWTSICDNLYFIINFRFQSSFDFIENFSFRFPPDFHWMKHPRESKIFRENKKNNEWILYAFLFSSSSSSSRFPGRMKLCEKQGTTQRRVLVCFRGWLIM